MRWPRSWHPEDPAPHRAAVFILPLIAHRLPLPTPLIAPSPIPPLKRYPESRCRGITAGLLERGLEVRLRGLQSIIVFGLPPMPGWRGPPSMPRAALGINGLKSLGRDW